MKITLSLDYELFFGRNTGTIENTLLTPTLALCDIAKRNNVPLVFFVDVGFLLCLQKEGQRYPALMRDYLKVCNQLEQLVALGHELQLHVHPHWETSYWDGNIWNMNMQHYALHSFKKLEVHQIIQRYTDALRTMTGDDGVFTFRAGGWVIQPFNYIRDALLAANIRIDSTVICGAKSKWDSHGYDFTDAPTQSHWFFDDDPLVMNSTGAFLEIPIASHQVSPDFYWRFLATKKLGGIIHSPLGDGVPVELSKHSLINKLFSRSIGEVSMDGYKASLLKKAANQYERMGKTSFVVMGHPKALTRYSLQQLEAFIVSRQPDEFVTYSAYRSLMTTSI